MRNTYLPFALLVLAAGAAGTARSLDAGLPARPAQSQPAARPTLPKLQVHAEGRYLVREDGTPFLYLADTAWELFHRPTREEASEYLQLRARQKFTVIHAVALAELEGLTDPNAYGDLPLVEKDPARPAVTPGTNPKDQHQYDYWDHVDFVVDEANRLGLYVAFLPTWARWLGVNARDEKVLTAANARTQRDRRFGGTADLDGLHGRGAQRHAGGAVFAAAGRSDR
jgi:hypothetical protein